MSAASGAGVRVWLCLGSNAGRRARRLRWALRELDRLPQTRLLRASRLLASSPVGGPPQPDFLNCCVLLRTRLSPMGLLTELKRLEALAGRKPRRAGSRWGTKKAGVAGRRPAPRWGPRPLDIDIVLYGTARLRTRLLTIPHPEALRRRFVLAGVAELSPRLRWPGRHASASQLLRRLKVPSQNVTVWGRSLPRRARRGAPESHG